MSDIIVAGDFNFSLRSIQSQLSSWRNSTQHLPRGKFGSEFHKEYTTSLFEERQHPLNPPWEVAICAARALSRYDPSECCNSCFPAYIRRNRKRYRGEIRYRRCRRKRRSRLPGVVISATRIVTTRKSSKRRFPRTRRRNEGRERQRAREKGRESGKFGVPVGAVGASQTNLSKPE